MTKHANWVKAQLVADYRRATRRLCDANAMYMAGYLSGLQSGMTLIGVDFKIMAKLKATSDAKFANIMNSISIRTSTTSPLSRHVEDKMRETINNLQNGRR